MVDGCLPPRRRSSSPGHRRARKSSWRLRRGARSTTLQHAQLTRLRAEIVFALRRGSDAPPLLLDAAKQLEPLDPGSAREAYLEALGAAIFAGRLNGPVGPLEVAAAAQGAPPGATAATTDRPPPRRAGDALHEGLRGRRCAAAACATTHSSETPEATKTTSGAGSGCHGSSPATCGTTRTGTSSQLGRSGSVGRPARSTSCRWRWVTARPCTCTPASSQRLRR